VIRVAVSVLSTALLSCVASSLPAWAGTGSGAEYGARDPAPCQSLKQAGPPNPTQAAALVRCRIETERSNELWLMKDVRVEIGGGRPYNRSIDTSITEADVNVPVYPIRGSFIWSICNTRSSVVVFGKSPDRNCRETDVPQATGACWRTTFGDWSCTLGGGPVGNPRPDQPPLK